MANGIRYTEEQYRALLRKPRRLRGEDWKYQPLSERKITEKAFQETIRKAALLTGWRYHHNWIAIHSPAGFPDLCMVHAAKKRLIFAELKADGKEPTEKQQEWLDDLTSVAEIRPGLRFEIYLWRPSQIDEIWEILRR